MLEVGCPDPALVEERTESTRNCAARSATASRLLPVVISVIVMITPVLPVGDATSEVQVRGLFTSSGTDSALITESDVVSMCVVALRTQSVSTRIRFPDIAIRW